MSYMGKGRDFIDFKRPEDIVQDGLTYVWRTNAHKKGITEDTANKVVRYNLGPVFNLEVVTYNDAITGPAANPEVNGQRSVGIYVLKK